MKIISYTTPDQFDSWSGATNTLDAIKRADKCDELGAMIEELYPDGLTETEFNDLLWFDSDWIFESLGIADETDEDD